MLVSYPPCVLGILSMFSPLGLLLSELQVCAWAAVRLKVGIHLYVHNKYKGKCLDTGYFSPIFLPNFSQVFMFVYLLLLSFSLILVVRYFVVTCK